MIYLIYVTKESGELIWSFKHPLSPTDLVSKIAGRDDVLISGLISAISSFGSETLGDRLQSIDFERYTLSFKYLPINGEHLLVAVVSDKSDSSVAVWRAIQEFFNKHKKEINVLADELSFLDPDKQNKLLVKLNRDMTKLLESKKRSPEILAYRNNKTLAIGLIPSLIVFFVMYFITDWLTDIYNLYPNPSTGQGNVGALIGLIVGLMFILPSVVMGYTIGFKEGARKGGLGLSAVGFIVLTIRYYNNLISWASNPIINVVYLLPLILLVVIYVVGAAMGSIGAFVAWHLVEKKTLTPAAESELFGQVDKLKLGEEVLEGIKIPEVEEVKKEKTQEKDILSEIKEDLKLDEEE